MTERENTRKAIVTELHKRESAALKIIWDKVNPSNQKEFGQEFGVGGQSAVANFLSGTSALSLKAAVGFAQGLGCRIMEFSPRLAEEARKAAEAAGGAEIDHEDFMAVRRADVQFSNGTGQVIYEEEDKPPLVFRVDFLRKLGIKNGDAVVVDSVGISNEPKIPEGAVVLVNRGDKERLNGELFAFRVNGELMIKRLERIDGVGILATADNPNFKPKQKVYAGVSDFEVIGRALWIGSLL